MGMRLECGAGCVHTCVCMMVCDGGACIKSVYMRALWGRLC